MTEPRSSVESDAPRDDGGHPGAPRWVKVAAVLVLLLIAALVISKLAGAEHGPGMHGGGAISPAQMGSAASPWETGMSQRVVFAQVT